MTASSPAALISSLPQTTLADHLRDRRRLAPFNDPDLRLGWLYQLFQTRTRPFAAKYVEPCRFLHLTIFRFWHMAGPDELKMLGVGRWLTMLDPDSLEFIQVGPARASDLFFQDITSTPPFTSLSAAEIAVMSETMLLRVPLFLPKTPALRYLHLPLFGFIPAEDGRRIAEGLKPPLESSPPDVENYCGPYELLHVFLGRSARPSPLRSLHLNTLGKNGEPFAICLQKLSSTARTLQLTNVTEFSTQFCSIECDDLAKLFALLPNLQDLELSLELRLKLEHDNTIVTKQTFLDDVLELQWPSQLQSLSIDWTASSSMDVASKHKTFQAELVTQCPLLGRLWLCDWTKSAFLWHRTMSGREMSKVYATGTLHSDAADDRCAVFSKKSWPFPSN